mmetsp:Transcript_31580/g.61811  ORF Transcript_31580/g.61811 Transcript_31580/m.61811 type:complete len:366 (+) Transcript_31580:860-1957(+)
MIIAMALAAVVWGIDVVGIVPLAAIPSMGQEVFGIDGEVGVGIVPLIAVPSVEVGIVEDEELGSLPWRLWLAVDVIFLISIIIIIVIVIRIVVMIVTGAVLFLAFFPFAFFFVGTVSSTGVSRFDAKVRGVAMVASTVGSGSGGGSGSSSSSSIIATTTTTSFHFGPFPSLFPPTPAWTAVSLSPTGTATRRRSPDVASGRRRGIVGALSSRSLASASSRGRARVVRRSLRQFRQLPSLFLQLRSPFLVQRRWRSFPRWRWWRMRLPWRHPFERRRWFLSPPPTTTTTGMSVRHRVVGAAPSKEGGVGRRRRRGGRDGDDVRGSPSTARGGTCRFDGLVSSRSSRSRSDLVFVCEGDSRSRNRRR